MKKVFFAFICLALLKPGMSQTNSAPAILYGLIQENELLKAPYSEWYKSGYDGYRPGEAVMEQLRKQSLKNITIQVFLGTWCGDSRREVPRLLKLLDELKFSRKNLQLIGVGGGDSLLKQSPQHEEAGKGIFRVPTIIIYSDGIEINRINEYPCSSLEDDLLTIIRRQPYISNYKSFALVRKWMNDSTLFNSNISTRSLAAQLRSLTEGDHELNSLAHLLVQQGKNEEALRLFLINYNLFPESMRVITGLGEGYSRTGDSKNAILTLEKALELNKDPKMVKEILPLLYAAKGINK